MSFLQGRGFPRIKCNAPKYLEKDGKYLIPFSNKSFKEVELPDGSYFRLTVGEYVSNNYVELTKQSDLVCLTNTRYKKYVASSKMKPLQKGIKRKDNYISNGKYIPKDNKHIIDSYYIYVKKHKALKGKEVTYIELNPKHNGVRYQIQIHKIRLFHNLIKTLLQPSL